MKNQYLIGDSYQVMKTLADNSVDMIFTSPPYLGVRNYNVDGQYGFGVSLNQFLREQLLPVFKEAKRVLKPSGTCWVNLGDGYGGNGYGTGTSDEYMAEFKQATNRGTYENRESIKKARKALRWPAKSLFLVPERFATLMEDELGWFCRLKIIWHKPNPMPDPFKDRPRLDFEHIYVFTKSQKIWMNYLKMKQPLSEATLERNKYPVKLSEKTLALRDTEQVEKTFAPIGGIKHAGYNGNPIYSGNSPKIHDGQAKIGSVWIWSVASASFGHEFCATCDKLVPSRDLLFKCKQCGTIYYKRQKPSDIAKANLTGLGCPNCGSKTRDPVCPVCKRKVHQHFAMFPERLPELAIKMACPDQVCTKCDKPRFPIYTPTKEYAKLLGKGWHDHSDDSEQGMQQDHDIPSVKADYRISGWSKCNCNAEFITGLVLDPFAGFNTTGAVAMKLGRDFLAIDIDQLNARAGMKRVEPYMKQARLI